MKEKQERNLPVYSTGLSDFLYPYETGSDLYSCDYSLSSDQLSLHQSNCLLS